MPAELADQAMAQQVKISDGIQYLVLDELILVPQAILVQDTRIVDHDGILEISAQRQIVRAQLLNIPGKAKRARAADLPQKCRGRKIHRRLLAAALEQGMIEFDLK